MTVTAVAAIAAQTLYGQCGGINWSGASSCAADSYCTTWNPWYYQCVPGTATSAPPVITAAPTTLATLTRSSNPFNSTSSLPYFNTTLVGTAPVGTAPVGTGPVGTAPVGTGPLGSATSIRPPYVNSTLIGTAPVGTAPVGTAPVGTAPVGTAPYGNVTSSVGTGSPHATGFPSAGHTSIANRTSIIIPTKTSASISPSATNSHKPKFAGINISGFDWGCSTNGTCDLKNVAPPLANHNGVDGIGQMKHFTSKDNLNIFRLPVGWQYLVNNKLGDLDKANFAVYDELVQGCLATGAYCIIDLHNYARWNGKIIGQGGPTNDDFAHLWSQLATHYANETKIWFGLMNEPHDLVISTWVDTVQAAVTAVRKAGATSQYISLPGDAYQSASVVPKDGVGAALAKVKNPDGTTDGLVFDVHKYLDSDNSGTSPECTTNNIQDTFEPLTAWLREQGRVAILTETGGGNTASCEERLCEQNGYLSYYSDVYLGYLGWSAGAFQSSYALVETPTLNGTTWTDTDVVKMCIARYN